MKEKLVVITGANAGIGKETTLRLAQLEAKIVMVCRNEDKGTTALKEIEALSGNKNLELMLCDFSSLNSIANFVENFKKKYDKIDVLLNNHGAVFLRKRITENGYESTFAVNHLGYMSLTIQLLDLVKASSYARIVNVASSANYRVKELNIEDYNWEKRRYKILTAYAESKLYNIMFTLYLSKLLKDSHVTVNCLHPGYIKTNLGINHSFLKPLNPLVKRKAKPLKEGAETSVYLVSSTEVDKVTGKYFHIMEEKEPNKLALDEDKQKELWDLSLKLVGLSFP
jgi:NAD(P)-dependent dehydrogenase (short-subunit alcohol dehydrogenase family)